MAVTRIHIIGYEDMLGFGREGGAWPRVNPLPTLTCIPIYIFVYTYIERDIYVCLYIYIYI